MPTLTPVRGAGRLAGRDPRQTDEWLYRLSATEIGELDDALAAVRRRGLDVADIRREVSRTSDGGWNLLRLWLCLAIG